MRYDSDITRLAHAVTALAAAGPPPAGSLTGPARQATLAARDTVTGELRDLARAVLQLPAHTRRDPAQAEVSPAHALHTALAALPPTGHDMSLTDALAVPGGPFSTSWQTAARSAGALQAYHDLLAGPIPGEQAWSIVADIARISAALPYLDADLATALGNDPEHDRTRQALLDPSTHGPLRRAADETLTHTIGLTGGTPDAEIRARPRIAPVRTTADLPQATATLARLIADRGPDLTADETTTVARTLAEGVDLTRRLLTAATDTPAHPAAAAAGAHLDAALPHLLTVAHGEIATLTTPAPAVLFLTRQIRERLTALSALAGHLQPGPQAARQADLQRILEPLSRWAAETAGPATQLRNSLHAAAAAGRLLTPHPGNSRGRPQLYLWQPTRTGLAHPIVAAAERSATHLNAAAEPLARIGGSPTSTVQRNAAARNAARDADQAAAELRAALAGRTPAELAHPPPPPPPPPPTPPSNPAANPPDADELHTPAGLVGWSRAAVSRVGYRAAHGRPTGPVAAAATGRSGPAPLRG